MSFETLRWRRQRQVARDRRIYAASAWDYQQARIEALEKDSAYHSELCTIQQARIDELEAAAEEQRQWPLSRLRRERLDNG